MFWYPNETDYAVRDANGISLKEFLDAYDPRKYERPSVTVDILAFKKRADGMELLLIRRGRHPYIGMLALPGGFVEMDESLEDAAARELFEETGVSGLTLHQLGAYGDPGRDPRHRVISIAYISVLPDDVVCRAGDDAAEAGFYRVRVAKNMNNLETFFELSLENETGSAGARVVERAGKRRIAASSVACDHAVMMLDALERLGRTDNMCV